MKVASTKLPTTMRAAQGRGYGKPKDMLNVMSDVKVPQLSDVSGKKRKDWAIIKTLTVAMAPGDCRVLSGKTSPLQGPDKFPYVPGGDVCGIIQELDENAPADLPFEVGDTVVAMFHDAPRGALGEYAPIHVTSACSKVPDNVNPVDAASLGSSGPAAIAIGDRIKEGDRVLILGAGGGVGSLVCQLARINGASYVVGVGRDPTRLEQKPLSVDKAVDYNEQDVFSMEEWQENQFDLIIDLASGGWLKLLEQSKTGNKSIVKTAREGGRYVTLTPDEPTFEAHSMWTVLKIFLFPALHRALYSRTTSRRRLPAYSYAIGLPSERTSLDRALTLMSEGKIAACIDPSGPFPLTTEGVIEAFELQESRHVKGKAVIQVADM
mmetsp:Transcript_3746/g.8105  ORF Transcript_3746/g.8105 Transcript_3746/m.8105 type:complete len:379 (+) Transcript_3746:88-1224(+)